MRRTISSLSVISVASLVGLASATAGAAVGGPDPFGYTFADQASGAVYDYIDITVTGVQIANGDDVVSAMTNLGAPFTFYGETVGTIFASTNGFVSSNGLQPDLSNDCPLPVVVIGGGFRIAGLHDDLVSTVYYQYLDEGQAAAAGYPGETAGISVVQWDGRYFNDINSNVDAEVILFHDDGTILSMVAAATQGGLGSTMGIQNTAATSGLTYDCNAAASVLPGVTAVEYSPPPLVSINEIRIDQTGFDDDEYFELVGPPGASLDGLTYIVIGDTPTGVIENVTNLTGSVIPASGYFVVAEAPFTIGTADLTVVLNFENGDTNTHMLVRSFTGAVNNDLDTNNDGTLDSTPWFVVSDALAVVDPDDIADFPYGPGDSCIAGPFCNELTIAGADSNHVFRCGDGDGGWNEGLLDELADPPSDTPNGPNACACGDGILVVGEVCDTSGESAMCDIDCTLPLCGDGVANMAAGEACDDGGESADCNPDCTAAVCGDGFTNVTAGETCDDMGESVDCDDDCTGASCGDGTTNMTAGETCDDGGESVTCDDDCTAAQCGDMVVNVMAGETCDDGGRSGTCNADCTAATCGDGIMNAAAGEECDGDGAGNPGETATCDDDCTSATCGDMVVNATAGEDCDDGDETVDCDADCTPVECGDSEVNAAAGEECDDGNTDDGDGCAADCTDEGAGSSSEGGESSDTGTGESSGTGAEESGTDDTASTGADTSGGTVADTSGGPATASDSDSVSDSDTDVSDSDSDSDTDSADDSSGGSVGTLPGDDGCSCTTDGGSGWSSLLALFGLGALRRRRRVS